MNSSSILHSHYFPLPAAKPPLLLLPNALRLSFPSNNNNKASFLPLAYVAATTPPPAEVERKKHDLLRAVQDTQRGLVTAPDQRSSIEEALVCVEGYGAGSEVDLATLDGTWRLNYTSASDVLGLFEAADRFPFFQVGQIFQKFECQGRSDGGIVRNVVRWSIPSLLEEHDGATLLVSAKFSVLSKRNIYLRFEEVSVENIKISEELQALIAPAILPRTFLNLEVLAGGGVCFKHTEYIWNSHISLKIQFFTWQMLHGGVLTEMALKKRGYQLTSRCSFCVSCEEDWWHIFFGCPSVKGWRNLIGLNSNTLMEIKDFWELWMRRQGIGGWKWRVWRMMPHAIWGFRWLERNRRIFQGCCSESSKEADLIS